jgi:flagellar basal body-associated protein FliL
MTSQLRAPLPVLAVLLALVAMLAGSVTARAESTPTYTKESLAQYEAQLKAGQIQSVVVNKRLRSLRITLKDGSHVFVKYEKKTGPTYYKQITAKGIPLTFLSVEAAKKEQEKSPKHHKIRYIAGGVLIVVLVIAAVILLVRRRRPEED